MAISALLSVILRSKATKDLDYVVPPWFDKLTTSGNHIFSFLFLIFVEIATRSLS
jgi:hypothetical protein